MGVCVDHWPRALWSGRSPRPTSVPVAGLSCRSLGRLVPPPLAGRAVQAGGSFFLNSQPLSTFVCYWHGVGGFMFNSSSPFPHSLFFARKKCCCTHTQKNPAGLRPEKKIKLLPASATLLVGVPPCAMFFCPALHSLRAVVRAPGSEINSGKEQRERGDATGQPVRERNPK